MPPGGATVGAMKTRARVWVRRVRCALLIGSGVHQVFQRGADAPALGHGLRHEDDEHVFLGIDPERGAARAGPVHLADGALVRAYARFRADRETKAKSETRSRQIIRPRHHAGSRSDMVRAHIGDGLRTEIALAVHGAAVEDHRGEAGVVADGGY